MSAVCLAVWRNLTTPSTAQITFFFLNSHFVLSAVHNMKSRTIFTGVDFSKYLPYIGVVGTKPTVIVMSKVSHPFLFKGHAAG